MPIETALSENSLAQKRNRVRGQPSFWNYKMAFFYRRRSARAIYRDESKPRPLPMGKVVTYAMKGMIGRGGAASEAESHTILLPSFLRGRANFV